MEHLLTVEDSFLIKGKGILILPHLDLPGNLLFKPFSDDVIVRRSDESEDALTLYVHFIGIHLNRKHSEGKIGLLFPNGTKETVHIGSQIFVSTDTWRKLKGDIAIQQDNCE